MTLCRTGSPIPPPHPARTVLRTRWIGALALILWNGSVSAQGADPQRLFQEAVAAQQRGDGAVAVRDYRELLRMHPDAVAVRVNLGATLADLKRFTEAIEQYRIALASDPTNRMVRMNLALAYRGNNELANAIKELERLHREDANDGQPVMLLADCLVQSGRYGDAIALLAPLEATQPDETDLEWLLGTAMIHAGRPERTLPLRIPYVEHRPRRNGRRVQA
jgi:Flp pilus assembly protein TadD